MKWNADAAFAVHPDFKSHTGGSFGFEGGKGQVITVSTKQKLNTRSSTEAEIVGVDDVSTYIVWTDLFMTKQGYGPKRCTVYQDNMSAIRLEKNGRRSAGKRSRAISVRYFFITDLAEKKKLAIEYCPTDEMVADYLTKPLQGEKFRKFRKSIMGQDVR